MTAARPPAGAKTCLLLHLESKDAPRVRKALPFAFEVLLQMSTLALKDDDDRLMSDNQVREYFGGITEMGLWRWERDESLNFPKAIYIGTWKFRSRREILEFRDRMAAASVGKKCPIPGPKPAVGK